MTTLDTSSDIYPIIKLMGATEHEAKLLAEIIHTKDFQTTLKILRNYAIEIREDERAMIMDWAKEQRRVWVKGMECSDLVSEYNDCLDDLINHITTTTR